MFLTNTQIRNKRILSRSKSTVKELNVQRVMILSFDDRKRIATLFQLFSNIDKRTSMQGSNQKETPAPSYAKATAGREGRKVSSLKKRAYLLRIDLIQWHSTEFAIA